MIACHCNAVCDNTILGAIADGAGSIDALSARCGAGARCGGCHDVLDTLLAAARAVDAAFGPRHAHPRELREAAFG